MRIVVTGCSSGIGLETALHLAWQGHQVVATVRNPATASCILANAAKREDLDLHIVALDVTNAASVTAGFAEAMAHLGGIDGLVNNAGISQLSAVEDLRPDDAAALIDTNYLGALRCCQAVLPAMRAQQGGAIVNVSSMNGQAAFAFTGGYAASKAALEAMSEALALEAERFGVTVAIVQPGVVDTAIADKALPRPDSAAYLGEAERLDNGRTGALDAAPGVAEVACVIETLLLDPAPPLRTRVGRDAVGILRRRDTMSDGEFFGWVRSLATQ